MQRKSVFLLQIKCIEKFKLIWQLKIGEGEVKLYYYAMKGSRAGEGSSQNNFLKKLKQIKDQNKKVHKKLEGGCLWFNIYYFDPDYLLKHISSSTLPPSSK